MKCIADFITHGGGGQKRIVYHFLIITDDPYRRLEEKVFAPSIGSPVKIHSRGEGAVGKFLLCHKCDHEWNKSP